MSTAAAVTFDRKNPRHGAAFTAMDTPAWYPSTAQVVEVVEYHRGELDGLATVKGYAPGDPTPRLLTVLVEDIILVTAGPFAATAAARRWYNRKRGL